MKIAVIGGSGLIGSRLVQLLRERGHEVLSASPRSGVNAVTGEGLAEALKGAQVVVDVSNSPSFEDGPVMEFFEKSTRNLLSTERAAGVAHHVVLSVVGTDRLQEGGYFRAKMVQENLITASAVPYTIVRATQFFEFMGSIAHGGNGGEAVRLSSAPMQPIAAADVSAALVDYALGQPLNGVVELAGPEIMGMDAAVRQFFAATGDPREVITDSNASYFGIKLDDLGLAAGPDARRAPTRFADWLKAAGRK